MNLRQDGRQEVLLNNALLATSTRSIAGRGSLGFQAIVRQALHVSNARLRRSDLRAGEEGGALLEMVLVLPMLMLLVTAIFAFGIALNNYLQLTDAVSIGARTVAISRGQTTDPCAQAVTAIEHAAPFLRTANLTFSFVLNGVAYSNTTSCPSASTSTGSAANLVQGGPAQVTATYPCNLAVYGRNYAPTCSMTAQTTELVQ